jgi:hypothetical protein
MSNETTSLMPSIANISSFVPTVATNGTTSFVPTIATNGTVSLVPTIATNGTATYVPTIATNVSVSFVPTIATNGTTSFVPTIATNGTTSFVPTIATNGTVSLVPTFASNGTATYVPTIATNGSVSFVPTIATNETASLVPTISSNETSSLVPTIATNGSVSLVPTIATNGTASLVPTITGGEGGVGPAGALYFEGFEAGQFPVAPWFTEGDAPWDIDTECARSGTYSIKSGDLDLSDLTTKYSNLTFITNADWPDGSLIISVLAGTELPIDELSYFVDGELRGKVSQSLEWQQLRISLSPGTHTILFSYISNPNGLLELPPASSSHLKSVCFDNVYYIPFGVTAAPTEVRVGYLYT